jgi:hypothetical protein
MGREAGQGVAPGGGCCWALGAAGVVPGGRESVPEMFVEGLGSVSGAWVVDMAAGLLVG